MLSPLRPDISCQETKYHLIADIVFSVEIIRANPVKRLFLIKKMISQVLMAYNNYADVENILINAKVSGRVFVANRRKSCPAQPLGWPVLLFIAIKKVYGLI